MAKKNGRPFKQDELSIEKKKEVLDQYIKMRKTHDYTQVQCEQGLGYSLDTILAWSKLPEMKGYPLKIKNADQTFHRNDPDLLIEAAKKSLIKVINGYEYVETTEKFRYNDKGEEQLIEKYVKKKKVEPDFEQIKWALERLSPSFAVNTVNAALTTFMQFTTYLQAYDPVLAQRVAMFQNNFLAEQTKEIKPITPNEQNENT